MTQQELRERIKNAAIGLLQESEDPGAITVRAIAERAGVGIGSINYNFGSKDNLLNEAIWQIIGEKAASWYQPQKHDTDPVNRLKKLFKEAARVAFQYQKFTRIGIQHVILQGDMQVQTLLLPLLREILGSRRTDLEIRLLSLQLVSSLQVTFLNAEAISHYLGMPVSESATIDYIIDQMIDNLIGHEPEENI